MALSAASDETAIDLDLDLACDEGDDENSHAPQKDVDQFKCICTRFQTSDGALFIKHLSGHPREQSLWCYICGKYISCAQWLVKHIQERSCRKRPRKYQCGSCHFNTELGQIFASHLLSAHRSVHFKPCVVCRKEFSSIHCLLLHLEEELLKSYNDDQDDSDKRSDSTSLGQSSTIRNTFQKVNDNRLNAGYKRTGTTDRPTIQSLSRNSDNGTQGKRPDFTNNTRTYTNTTKPYNNNNNNLKNDVGKPNFGPNANQAQIKKSSTDSKHKSHKALSDKLLIVKSPSAITGMLKLPYLAHFFKCTNRECTFTSNSKEEFEKHVSNHRDRKNICAYCWLEFDIYTFVGHMLKNHGFSNYQCSLCFYRACSKYYVQLHQMISHKEKVCRIFKCKCVTTEVHPDANPTEINFVEPYHCTVEKCSYSTYEPLYFVMHTTSHHSYIKVLKCYYCYHKFLSVEDLVRHYEIHQMNAFQCGHCVNGSATYSELVQHMSLYHANKPIQFYQRTSQDPKFSNYDLVLSSKFNLTKDGTKESVVIDSLDSSAGKQNDDFQQCVCGICGDRIRQTNDIRRHRYMHIYSSHVYKCPECHNEFSTFRSLHYHGTQSHKALNIIFLDPCPRAETKKNMHFLFRHNAEKNSEENSTRKPLKKSPKCTWRVCTTKCNIYVDEDVYDVHDFDDENPSYNKLLKDARALICKTTPKFDKVFINCSKPLITQIKEEKLEDWELNQNKTSTAAASQPSDSVAGFSFYGKRSEPLDLENLLVRVKLGEYIKLPALSFYRMFNCEPEVRLVDIKTSSLV